MEDTDTHASQVELKRRRVRKGTRSCWECKRRKMKCILDTANTDCNGCRRRGSKCVSQEYHENLSFSMPYMTNPFDAKTAPSEDGRRADRNLTPTSMNSEPSRSLAFYQNSSVEHDTLLANSELYKYQSAIGAQEGKYERLSQFLHQSLPSREDTERICNANRHPSVLAHEILTVPYTILLQNGLKTPESLLETPEPNLHPVLIARHMLQLAIFLQHVHPKIHKEMSRLSEPPRTIMERLADLAISLVTTNEELLGSIEGLECVMIESMYQANVGNLRRAWVAGRRAIGIAQLMGLDRLDKRAAKYKVLEPKTKYHDPEIMWFRIIFLDRHLSLMLGLPQGHLDCSMASEEMLASDTSVGRLERVHTVLASQILKRNESSLTSDDLALKRSIDMELQNAARSLPSKWWLAPTLDNITSTDSKSLFWDTRRLFAQVLHYNLLNQLHLPYMLHSSSAEHKDDYSRITCMNASREILSRFVTLRTFDRVSYSGNCRIVDFLALMAAMTLLLAHLGHHSSDAGNPLDHQYFTDRAMIEQAQENMEEVNRLNSDPLSAQSADLLRKLLAIEFETADCSRRVSVHETEAETALPDADDSAIVSVHIPYFGIIKIAREGVSKEVRKPQATTTNSLSTQLQLADKQSPPGFAGGYLIDGVTAPAQTGHVEEFRIASQEVPTGANDAATFWTPQYQNDFCDSFLPLDEYPELATGGQHWALQGVDIAFFDNLMRSGNDGNNCLTS